MRALIVLLVLLASLASARETIVSGDSDHTILPSGDITPDHSREVLLFRGKLKNKTGNSPFEWYRSWQGQSGAFNKCVPMRGIDADDVYVLPGDCSAGENNWTTNRSVVVTRVGLILHKAAHFALTIPNCAFRFAKIDTSGSVTGITSSAKWPIGAELEKIFSASVKLTAGDSIGFQIAEDPSLCIVEDNATKNGFLGEVQIWGVYE